MPGYTPRMERWLIERRLADAEQHVVQGLNNIEQHRRLIEKLKRGGNDTTRAEEILKTLLSVQALHEQDRDRLRAELHNE